MLDCERLKKIRRIVQRKTPNVPIKVLREAIILWLLKTGRDLEKMENAVMALKPTMFFTMAKKETFL